MTISKTVEGIIANSSFIRKMFEEGARLKAEHGPDNVFDFSLGNPNLPPPAQFKTIMHEIIDTEEPGIHGYMPQPGYPQVRNEIAAFLTREYNVDISGEDVLMTCGAAGALNVIFKALLDPQDEVLSPQPCFVEYRFYVENHGGVFKTVPTKPDFSLDLEALAGAITEKTKVVLINSPNNPTGQVYSKASLDSLGALLENKSKALGRTIYLVSDEPYRKIVYDDVVVPSIFESYKESIVATSYSKDISIPGERIGFVAVNPRATFRGELAGAMAITNRILGFVNAPAIMQRAVARLQGLSVDINEYKRKRDLLCDGLAASGYEFIRPPGAFYLFPKAPTADDVAFTKALQEELILTVPGSGFAGPGYFRIAFCCDDETIVNALPGFAKVMQRYR
ncbi:MAG: pyridoxal phosphate-dependent aminotransferase [Deltaproteobacteria bacterium]|nr:MAG: pyridoxal phosphate-dependent aminotransferase [Deltaproteobacteria bacterium]